VSSNVALLIDVLEPSIFMIIWLQLFNWFSKKQVAVIFGLLSIVKALANYSMTYLSASTANYRFLVGGGLMFLFTFVDGKLFKFYPLEAGIFIDVSGRNRNDLELFH